jgi:hypothetical protein
VRVRRAAAAATARAQPDEWRAAVPLAPSDCAALGLRRSPVVTDATVYPTQAQAARAADLLWLALLGAAPFAAGERAAAAEAGSAAAAL